MSEQHYYYGTGRRKTSIAKVRLYPGNGSVVINGKPIDEALPWETWRKLALEPLVATNTAKNFNVVSTISGGGIVSQAGALSHGIARALLEADANLRLTLKKNGLLTRDAREKERKKVGLRRARKAKQYSKR